MFSQRRKKYRNMVWASVLTAVVLLSFIVLLGYLGSLKDNPNAEAPVNETVSTTEDAEETGADEDAALATEDESEAEDEQLQTEEKKETYYLLKYDNDVIRIYFSDQQGKLTELEETAIVYETLSTEDQIQFQDGIQVDSRDALNRLLMDYES